MGTPSGKIQMERNTRQQNGCNNVTYADGRDGLGSFCSSARAHLFRPPAGPQRPPAGPQQPPAGPWQTPSGRRGRAIVAETTQLTIPRTRGSRS